MKIKAILIIFITMNLITLYNPIIKTSNEKIIFENNGKINNNLDKGTEYWALIIGVGEYYNHSEQNRLSMLGMVDILPDVLLQSSNWKSDHIHTLKSSQVTTFNIIKQFIWLYINADKDDLVLIYITTHGGQLTKKGQPLDLPPKDEADGADEFLVTYYGFEKGYSIITDDMLNILLSLLRAQGLCVIIDSCYSGGFNDPPILKTEINEKDRSSQNFNEESFKQGFIEDIASQNRIVLMSCEEDSLSFGNFFSDYITLGFWDDMADKYGNGDDKNSAEESFNYADNKMNENGGTQDPTILDLYPGEFIVTFTEDFFDKPQALDIAVTRIVDNKISVLSGDGLGGFGNYRDYNVGNTPTSVISKDFNLDNILDLAVSNFDEYDIRIFLGDGYGGFNGPQDYSIGKQKPMCVIAEDFNMDGIVDLATANSPDTISILLGDGHGGFGTQQDYGVGGWPWSIDAGDFNKDGFLDLASANFDDNDISILFGDGLGGFSNRIGYSVGRHPTEIITDYFNNDDILDLAVSSKDGINIFLGANSGEFGIGQFLPFTDGISGIASGKINKDGFNDLVLAGKNSVYTMFGDSLGEFGDIHQYSLGSYQFINDIILNDFNMDGFLDFAVISKNTFWVTIFLGDGVGSFEIYKKSCLGGEPYSIATGDFNSLIK
jgi:hypothetical protein